MNAKVDEICWRRGHTLQKKKKKNGNDNNHPCAPTLTGAIVRTCKKVSIRYFALNAGHFIKYKWLLKDSNGKLFCKPCTQFPEISKQSDKFVKGWAGNKQRFKDELIASNSIQKRLQPNCYFQTYRNSSQVINYQYSLGNWCSLQSSQQKIVLCRHMGNSWKHQSKDARYCKSRNVRGLDIFAG